MNPKFEVSNMGNVRWIGGKTQILIQAKRVGRCSRINQAGLHINLHSLVAEVWIPKPATSRKLTVKHIDGDTRNNLPSNLEWYEIPFVGGRKKHNAEGITVTTFSDVSWEDRLSEVTFSTPKPKQTIVKNNNTGKWVVQCTFDTAEDAIAFANQQ
jgi:hypothetical protein